MTTIYQVKRGLLTYALLLVSIFSLMLAGGALTKNYYFLGGLSLAVGIFCLAVGIDRKYYDGYVAGLCLFVSGKRSKGNYTLTFTKSAGENVQE